MRNTKARAQQRLLDLRGPPNPPLIPPTHPRRNHFVGVSGKSIDEKNKNKDWLHTASATRSSTAYCTNKLGRGAQKQKSYAPFLSQQARQGGEGGGLLKPSKKVDPPPRHFQARKGCVVNGQTTKASHE